MNPAPTTIDVSYTCSIAPPSGSTASATSVGLTAAITSPTAVIAGGSADVAFSSTQALPTSLISSTDMAQATGVEFSADAPVTYNGTSSTLKLSSSAALTAASTQIPATTPQDTNLPLPTQGSAVVGLPTTVQILPTGAAGVTFTAITCSLDSTTTAKPISITVSAKPSPPVTTPSYPVYTCTITADGKQEYNGPGSWPMSLRVSGKLTTGSTDTITWVSPSDTANPPGLGGPYTGASELVFQGSLPVTGAQQGNISLYRATRDVGLTVFKVTGSLFLSKPGTISVHLPRTFKITVSESGPNGATATAVLSCAAKSTPVGLTLKVTGKPVQPAPQASTTPIPSGTGTPVGAPNTGGGRPASSLPLVAGGAALLAVGAGLGITARRRRHSVN